MTTRRDALAAVLHALDPEDSTPSTPEQRRVLIERLTSDSTERAAAGLDLDPAPPAVAAPVRRRRSRLAAVVAVGVVLLAVAGGVVVVYDRQTSIAVPAGPPFPNAVDPVDQATIDRAEQLVVASNPSAEGRLINCGDFTFPAWRFAIPGGAENGTTPEAVGLREFLAGPQEPMSPQAGGNWVVLAEGGGKVLFGQREGVLGVGSAVVLADKGGTWTFSGSGGCGTGLVPGPGEEVQRVYSAHLKESTLHLTWEGGTDSCSTTVVRRVETRRDAAGLHVLIVTHTRLFENLTPNTTCMGVGQMKTADVSLQDPLKAALIFDDSSLPSHKVLLDA